MNMKSPSILSSVVNQSRETIEGATELVSPQKHLEKHFACSLGAVYIHQPLQHVPEALKETIEIEVYCM